ncbi:MAG: amino acid permease [Myxococcales bacterium]|nr:amino acid permease [Myxococcales bacterium]
MTAGRLVARLGRLDALAIGIGSVVGVGIFRTSGEVLRGAGGVAGSTAVWVGVGLLSLVGATVYADMALLVPEAGGPYAYVREAFGRPAAFVDGWFSAAVSMPTRQAAGFAVIGELVAELVGGGARTWSFVAVVALWALHVSGVRAGANAQRAFAALKLVTVAAVVVLAAVAHGRPAPERALSRLPDPCTLDVAVAGAWYAYLGWQDVTHLAEELERPMETMRALLVTIVALVVACYVLVSLAVVVGLGDGAAARGAMPVRALAEVALGPVARAVMGFAILSSMVGGVAEGMMVRPRLWFALGRDGLAPRALAAVGRAGAPHVAMTVHALLVAAFLMLTGSFAELVSLLALSQALSSTLEASSAIALRRRRQGDHRPARHLLYAVANAAAAALIAAHEPQQLAYALLFVVALGAGYAIRVRRRV